MKVLYLFPIIATTLFWFLNYYVFRSITARFNSYKFGKKIKFFTAIFCLAFWILEMIYFISIGTRAMLPSEFFYKICVYAMAVSFGVFLVCMIYDIFEITLKTTKFNENRRKFLKITLDISFVIIAFTYLFKGFLNAFRIPKINEVEVKIKNLQDDLNLAVVSDIHLGEFLKRDFLQVIVDQINSIQHDAVAIVGDMFDIKAEEIGDMLEPLKQISKPIFFVTGNHEYYRGAENLIKVLQNNGVKVLQNECIELGGINLIGVHDRSGEKFNFLAPNFKNALSSANPQKPKVLLAHQPKFINENVKDEVDLCVCGHTHAGQIFPFSLLVMIDQKYLHGLYDDGVKQIYVSSGAGFWGPPMRFLAPNEIALLKLRKA